MFCRFHENFNLLSRHPDAIQYILLNYITLHQWIVKKYLLHWHELEGENRIFRIKKNGSKEPVRQIIGNIDKKNGKKTKAVIPVGNGRFIFHWFIDNKFIQTDQWILSTPEWCPKWTASCLLYSCLNMLFHLIRVHTLRVSFSST